MRGEVEKLATELGGRAYPCDVASDESLAALAAQVKAEFGSLATLVHSIAFVNKEDLAGKVYTTSRSGFALAADISAFSLIALTNALVNVLADGASVMALTYLGSTAIVPNYNVAGIVKAALESIVRYLAYDLGDRGIRVNAISAGPISTASSRRSPGIFTHFLPSAGDQRLHFLARPALQSGNKQSPHRRPRAHTQSPLHAPMPESPPVIIALRPINRPEPL